MAKRAAAALFLVLTIFTSCHDTDQENTLKRNLSTMRRAIDEFHSDHRRYAESLNELVVRGYLPRVPADATGRTDTWQLRFENGGVSDVRSGSPGRTRDGVAYSDL
jgi:general secretion pathway protein G